ncbi:MAG: MarR family winged helix-turn-helix transcriptional regulator [Desulfurococcaceae archaeon]
MPNSLNKYDIEILRFLYRVENPIYQNDVPSMINLDPKLVSKSLYKLEKMGLVSREPVVHRKRRTYILRIDKKKILEVLEKLGESPLSLREIVLSVIKVPCITCQYTNRCYEGGFYDPLTCPWLSGFLRSGGEASS